MGDFAIRLVNVAMYNLWQILPLNLASGIGSFLVRFISRRYHRTTAAARRTRLQVIGLEHIRNAMNTGRPIIVPFLHLGNWELITHVLVASGITLNSIGEIQNRKVFDYMLNRARAANRLHVIRPDFEGTREIYQCLQRGETLGIGLDEYKNGRVWGPRFGRKFSQSTNLDYLLRLAKKFNAVLLPMFITRQGGVNFVLHISPPITSEIARANNRELLRRELEDWSEKMVRAHIDQWYMLHRLRFN